MNRGWVGRLGAQAQRVRSCTRSATPYWYFWMPITLQKNAAVTRRRARNRAWQYLSAHDRMSMRCWRKQLRPARALRARPGSAMGASTAATLPTRRTTPGSLFGRQRYRWQTMANSYWASSNSIANHRHRIRLEQRQPNVVVLLEDDAYR